MITSTWGQIASSVASLIAAHPDLGRRLALSPAWALHATAAYIHAKLAVDQALGEIADNIAARRPRDLLEEAVPNTHVRLPSTLKRLGDNVHDLSFYYRLNELLHGPAAEIVLGATTITAGLLGVAGMIAADSVLVAAHRAIDVSDTDAKSLAEVLRYLRGMALAHDIETLPTGSGWQAIIRRCKADLARAVAPPAPFGIPAGWYMVATIGQLFQIGERMKNCVGGLRYGGDQHLIDLMTGRSFYLAMIDDPPALATIRNIGPRMWTLGEISVQGKREAMAEARALLKANLATEAAVAGHTFFDLCPLSLLSSFTWKIEERRADAEEEDELDEVA